MILHVISGLGMGGAERNLFQTAQGMRQKGFDQHVACVGPSGIWAEELAKGGIPVTALNATSYPTAAFGLVKLVGLVNRLKPSILQGWLYHGDLFAALAHRFARGRSARRLFWNLRASNMDRARYGRIVRINSWLSGMPETVIANTQPGLDLHLAEGYKPRRSIVIPNGIDTDFFKPDAAARRAVRGELSLPQDATIAIHVARLDPMKDHASFIAAMAQLPHLLGIMVGKGTEDLSVPVNVRGLGMRRDVPHLYAGSDIVVSTSIFGEGFSNILAEGMSAGLVPVATDISDARKIVGGYGEIVAPGDVAALTAALSALSAKPKTGLASQGLRARDHIVSHFGLSRAVDAFANLYQSEKRK